MASVRITITLEAILVDSFSDYLIGVHDAAVEVGVSEGKGPLVLRAFIEGNRMAPKEVDRLAAQVDAYGRELGNLFACTVPTITADIIEDQDWSENWKAYFKPFAIVPGLVIAPTWEAYRAGDGERVISMDPGMAFGTGQHETTRLCLELLQQSGAAVSDAEVLDVGTGTGILGMAALLFGASHVLGLDNDPEAVRVAAENIRLNNLSGRMEAATEHIKNIDAGFDIVMANIVHDVLLELSNDLARLTKERGLLILSGLLAGEQVENLIRCFEQKSFVLKKERMDGQWGALLFEKSTSGAAA